MESYTHYLHIPSGCLTSLKCESSLCSWFLLYQCVSHTPCPAMHRLVWAEWERCSVPARPHWWMNHCLSSPGDGYGQGRKGNKERDGECQAVCVFVLERVSLLIISTLFTFSTHRGHVRLKVRCKYKVAWGCNTTAVFSSVKCWSSCRARTAQAVSVGLLLSCHEVTCGVNLETQPQMFPGFLTIKEIKVLFTQTKQSYWTRSLGVKWT